MERSHQNFTLKPTGLWISPDDPHIGATPDAQNNETAKENWKRPRTTTNMALHKCKMHILTYTLL